jgi:stage V sporulation protein B
LLVFVVIVLFSVTSPADVLIVPIAFFINTTVNSALLFVTFFKKDKSTTQLSSVLEAVKGWKALLHQSLPVGAASIAGQFILNFPIILLGAFGASSDIGNFSAASKLIFFLLVVDRAIYVLFYPLVSHTFAADPSRLGNQVHRILGYLLLASLPICVGGYVLARPLITFVFGPQYEDSSPFFQILLFYFLFTVLNSIFAYVVIAVGKERRYSTIIVAVSSLVIVSLLPLTYYWKGVGGAWGMAGGELLMMSLMYRECAKSISPRLVDASKKPLVCSLLMGAILLSFPHIGLALSLALGISSYFLCIILLKGITKEDFIFLRERLI